MDGDTLEKRIGRIIEFLNYGNLYGAKWFLQKLIDDSVADKSLGPDITDWHQVYQQENPIS